MIGIYIICYILFPLTVLPFCRRKKEVSMVLLTKEETNIVKGLAAIFIVLAHMVIEIEGESQQSFLLLKPITVLGGMGVLLFFFLSGYGIYKGYAERKLGWSFLGKRIKTIYVPYIIMKLILYAINLVLGFKTIDINVIEYVFLGDWFVQVIMIQYFIFFLAHKVKEYSKNVKLEIPTCVILSCILGAVFIIQERPAGWYNGLLLFPFGLWIAKHEKWLMKLIDKRKYMIFGASVVGFGATGLVFTVFKDEIWAIAFKMLSGVMLAVLVVWICRYIHLNSTVMKYIGIRSMYVYVVHVSILEMLRKTESMDVISESFLLLATSLVLVELIWIFNKQVEKFYMSKG